MDDRYRRYFEEMPCCVSVQDPDLRILDTNRRFRDVFGDGAGAACYEVTRHRTEKCPDCIVEQTFREGRGCESEAVVTARDGNELPVRLSTQPIHDEQGRVTAVMVITAYSDENCRAQGLFNSLGFLVGSITHGIKGQLTGVDGGVYLMNSGFAKDSPERVRKGLDMVQRNVERIRGMVQDVLYYAKDRILQRETVRVRELVKDLGEKIQKKAAEAGVEFVAGEPAEDIEFSVDPKAIRSMLANILEHSLDACRTDTEKEAHRVRLAASEDADQMIFTIEDSSAGINEETREKAFSPLLSSRGLDGTGPGLFIANKIAASHGGTIEADATQGVGTTFVIKIPKRAHEDPEG